MKRKSKLDRILEDIEFLYRYYFTDEFREHGSYGPTIGFEDINDVLEKMLKALIVIGKRVKEKEK